MADSRIPADVNDAVYRLVKDYGPEKLASKTGTPTGTIYNKANPHDTSHHKPTLSDVLIWTLISNDYRIIHAICRAVGGVFVETHALGGSSDMELLDLVLRREKEDGEFADALMKALQARRISPAAFSLLRKEGYEAATALMELLARLESMVNE